MNGEEHELEQGVDFPGQFEAFRNRFFNKATEAGIEVRTAKVTQARTKAIAAALESGRRTVEALPDVIEAATDPDERKRLKDRLARMRRERRDTTDLLIFRFYPNS
jgi:hypothetical protein